MRRPADGIAETAQSDSHVFDPQSTLRARMGPRDKEAEVRALARAEAALATLSANFDAWMDDDLSKLYAARDAMLLHGVDDRTIDQLFTPALDLKSLGATYDFPLVTRLAASLCKLLGDGDTVLQGPLPLVDAHVSAIKATVREGARSGNDPMGLALAGELERHTNSYLSGDA